MAHGQIRFRCPHCGKLVAARPERAGGLGTCPGCRGRVRIPEEEADRLGGLTPPARLLAPAALTTAVEPPPVDDEGDHGPLSPPTQRIDPEELIDMTAMVDIVFFLLIFFLVTSMAGIHSSTPLPRPEGEESGAAALPTLEDVEAEGDLITVRIGADDSVELDDAPLADLGDLGFRLSELRRAGRGADGMLVIAHGDATNGVAVAVLDAGYDAGMPKVRLAVSDREAE